MLDDDSMLEYLAQDAPKGARRQRRRQTAISRENSLLYVRRALESDKLSPKKRDRLEAKLEALELRDSAKKQRYSRKTTSTDTHYEQRGTQLHQQRAQEQALEIIYQVLPGRKKDIEQLAPRTFLHRNVVYRVKINGENIRVSAKTVPPQLERGLRYEYRTEVINGRRDKYHVKGKVDDLSTLAQKLKTIQDRCIRSMPRIIHAPNPQRVDSPVVYHQPDWTRARYMNVVRDRRSIRIQRERSNRYRREQTPTQVEEQLQVQTQPAPDREQSPHPTQPTGLIETLHHVVRAAYGERAGSAMEAATTAVSKHYKAAGAVAALLTLASFVGYHAVTRSSANDQLSLLTNTDVSLRLVERGENQDTYVVLPYSETPEDVQRDIEFEQATGIPTGVLYQDPEGYRMATITMQRQGNNYTSGKIKLAEGRTTQVANASVSLDRILNLPGQSSVINNKLTQAQEVHHVRQQYGHGHR